MSKSTHFRTGSSRPRSKRRRRIVATQRMRCSVLNPNRKFAALGPSSQWCSAGWHQPAEPTLKAWSPSGTEVHWKVPKAMRVSLLLHTHARTYARTHAKLLAVYKIIYNLTAPVSLVSTWQVWQGRIFSSHKRRCGNGLGCDKKVAILGICVASDGFC